MTVSTPARSIARWIELASWSFAAFGALLPLLLHTPPFAAYRRALAEWAYGAGSIAPADEKLLGLMLGILGGSIAGKWLVHAWIARGPLSEGRAWARDLTLLGLGAWFLVDSLVSLALGAAFNVWMINLVPMAIVGLPLVLAYRSFDDGGGARDASAAFDDVPRHQAYATEPSAAVRACLWTALFGASTGAMIAFGGNTVMFTTWFDSLASAHYGGAPVSEPARRLALFFFGPIGGSTLAQFLMLAGVVTREGATRRTAVAGALSIAAWFVIDSGYGLVHDGWFNILMINMPAVVITLPPWLLLWHASRRPEPGPRATAGYDATRSN